MEEKIAVLEIKARCIQYLRDNPERFVESDEETLSNMFRNMGSSLSIYKQWLMQ